MATVCLAAPAAVAQEPCGREGPACTVPLGEYRLAVPGGTPPPAGFPAVMFFHGAGGSGAQTLGNSGMVQTFLDRGWAVIAADGTERLGRSAAAGRSIPIARRSATKWPTLARYWTMPGKPAGLTARAFSSGVFNRRLADLVSRLRRSVARRCLRAVAGAFWRPHPEMGSCAGPVRLLHTHGWRDETVPLEGRPLRGGEILQGDVFHGLEVLRDANGCTGLRADAYETDGAF